MYLLVINVCDFYPLEKLNKHIINVILKKKLIIVK